MRVWHLTGLALVVLVASCASFDSGTGAEGINEKDTASTSETDDSDTVPGDDTVGNGDDPDGDGFTLVQGDCLEIGESAPFVGPHALEDLGEDGTGDGVDNDCDGETDEEEQVSCDCDGLGISAWDFADAIGLCDRRFVVNATLDHSAPGNQPPGYPYVDPQSAVDTVQQIGSAPCLVQQEGCEMAALSSGPLNQGNPNSGAWELKYMGQHCSEDTVNLDPIPQYQGDTPTTDEAVGVCDRTQLTFELTAPANAQGFSFDFLFASSEYPEYIGRSFNDTFYAVVTFDGLNDGATTNISFDSNGNEMEVNTNYFENSEHTCDESGSEWSPDVSGQSGSTGWLRTTWPIAPGGDFTLTFSIHDEEDYSYDSLVLIDNWQWSTVPVEPETGVVPI